jgi:EpsI family protein
MTQRRYAQFALCGMMLLSAGLTKQLTPTVRLAEVRAPIVLEQAVPTRFGDWTQVDTGGGVVDPQIQDELKRIYTQTLARTYVNGKGEQVMLSIAYGKDQSDTTQVHYPEICYPAQGFQVLSNRVATLATPSGIIPVRRLETSLEAQRYEPVTYWTTVGDVVVVSRMEKKLAEMRYGFHGEIPDGLLFRVSSINRDTAGAFQLQDSFVQALVARLGEPDKLRLTGLPR